MIIIPQYLTALWLPRADASTNIAKDHGETDMADGLLGGLLGEDDEKLQVEARDALADAEAYPSKGSVHQTIWIGAGVA